MCDYEYNFFYNIFTQIVHITSKNWWKNKEKTTQLHISTLYLPTLSHHWPFIHTRTFLSFLYRLEQNTKGEFINYTTTKNKEKGMSRKRMRNQWNHITSSKSSLSNQIAKPRLIGCMPRWNQKNTNECEAFLSTIPSFSPLLFQKS